MHIRALALTLLLIGCASSAPEPVATQTDPAPEVVTEPEPAPVAEMPAPVVSAPEPEPAPEPIIIEAPPEAVEDPAPPRSIPVEPAATPARPRPSRSLSRPPPVMAEMPAAPIVIEPSKCEEFADANGLQDKMTCVSVLYGTNRTVTDNPPDDIRSDRSDRKRAVYDQGDLFSIRPDSRENCEPNALAWRETNQRQDVCHMGEVIISIPAKRDRKLNKGGGAYKALSSGRRITAKAAGDYFIMFDHRSMDGDYDLFQSRVSDIIGQSETAQGHAFVYIHGFNVPFRNAAFRTAQLKYDMDFDGPSFFFSWPSNGSLLDYLSDQEDADLSVDALVRFLRLTHANLNNDPDNPVKLHIIAHSMGTRVTAQALARLSDFPDSPSFGHVIFAAGDLDTNLFEEWMGASSNLYDGVTIYTSRQDKAVGFSGWLRNLSSKMSFWGANNDQKTRIGFYEKKSSPSVFDLPSDNGERTATTIDISEAAKSSFMFKVRHSVYAESKIVTDDIRYLFDHPFSSPEERSSSFMQLCEGDTHWTFMTPKALRRHKCKP